MHGARILLKTAHGALKNCNDVHNLRENPAFGLASVGGPTVERSNFLCVRVRAVFCVSVVAVPSFLCLRHVRKTKTLRKRCRCAQGANLHERHVRPPKAGPGAAEEGKQRGSPTRQRWQRQGPHPMDRPASGEDRVQDLAHQTLSCDYVTRSTTMGHTRRCSPAAAQHNTMRGTQETPTHRHGRHARSTPAQTSTPPRHRPCQGHHHAPRGNSTDACGRRPSRLHHARDQSPQRRQNLHGVTWATCPPHQRHRPATTCAGKHGAPSRKLAPTPASIHTCCW